MTNEELKKTHPELFSEGKYDPRKMAAELLATLRANEHKISDSPRRPYYNEKCATELAEILLKIVTTGKPHIVMRGSLSRSSFTNKVSQAKHYLLEVADLREEGRWSDIIGRLAFRPLPNGVRISPKSEAGILEGLIEVEWRPEFLEFLEGETNEDKFVREGIFLSQEDQMFVKQTMAQLGGEFMFDVRDSGLTVIKISRKSGEDNNEEDNTEQDI